ncbi:MAG: hypothetical protein ACRD0U_17495 [Acidimicrobiales bacterium]
MTSTTATTATHFRLPRVYAYARRYTEVGAMGATFPARPGFVPAPWTERLAAAAALIDHPAPAPMWVADQVGAAARHAGAFLERFSALAHQTEPGRRWEGPRPPADDAHNRALHIAAIAAALGCRPCPHLRVATAPTVAFLKLPLYRADCERGDATFRPPGDADRCDLCGRRGVSFFTPIALQAAGLVLVGELCAGCACLYANGAAA